MKRSASSAPHPASTAIPLRRAGRKAEIFLRMLVLLAVFAGAGTAGAEEVEASISTTPVAAYSFDAGEGAVAEDLFGEHDGAISGASWFDNGRFGKALSFDAENDCVTVEDAPDLQLSEEFTLETWIKPQGPDGTWEPILFKEGGENGAYSIWLGAEPGKVEGYVVEEGEEMKTAVTEFGIGKNIWAHVALTYDGAWMRLYVDGELADATYSVGVTPSEGPLQIGCSLQVPENYGGLIDEVRIYNRALGGGEIAADMGSGLQTPSRDPVAAYSFDAGEGAVAEDLFGEHDGAIEGASWFDNGRFGKALSFDNEKEDCVTVEDAPDLQLTEEFTLETWIKPRSDGYWEPIVFKERTGGGSYSLFLGLDEAGHLEGYVLEEGEDLKQAIDPHPIPENVWSHVALTYDGAWMRLYVNGEEVDTTYSEGAIVSNGPLSIGCSNELETWFGGLIDEVRIYNRALGGGEIAADMGSGLQTPSRDPVAAYSFGAGEGAVAEAVFGEHDGEINGATWFANGKYGKALSFDGEDDCVSVPSAPALQLTEEFTLSIWIKSRGTGSWEPILSKNGAYSIWLGEESGHLRSYLREEDEDEALSIDPNGIGKNVWAHVAVTYDGAWMRLYVDGEKVDKAWSSGAAMTASPLSIGCSEEPHKGHFEGLIDEVRLYNRALGIGEVVADMGEAVPLPPTAVTEAADVLGPSEAIFLGTVDPNNTETTYRFEYGTTTSYGQFAPATEEEVVGGDGDLVAEEAVPYLAPSTTYHYRLIATNRAGTAVGLDKTLTTPASELSPEQEAKEREEEEDFTASISTLPPDFVNLNFVGLDENMENVAATGAGMYRISLEDLTRFSLERSKYDKVFEEAAKNKLKVLFVMGSRHFTAKKAVLAKWAERIVRRYGKARAGKSGSLWKSENEPFAPTYWEVWNEPNIGLNSLSAPPPQAAGLPPKSPNQRPGPVDPAQFGNFLEAMSNAIKKVEPEATVILGSLLSVGNSPKNRLQEEQGKEDEINAQKFLRDMKHFDDYDAVGFHPYAFKANNGKAPSEAGQVNQVRLKVRAAIVRFRDALNKLSGGPGKEIWITEIGWPVDVGDEKHPAVTENIQASLVKSTFSTIKAIRAKKKLANVFYFNYRDAPGRPEWDFNTGLIDDNMEPRESLKAFEDHAKK